MQAITFFFRTMQRFAEFLDTPVITYNNVNISLFDIHIAFLVIGLVAAVFWRGART